MTLSVLTIEDNPLNHELTRDPLEAAGYNVELTKSVDTRSFADELKKHASLLGSRSRRAGDVYDSRRR